MRCDKIAIHKPFWTIFHLGSYKTEIIITITITIIIIIIIITVKCPYHHQGGLVPTQSLVDVRTGPYNHLCIATVIIIITLIIIISINAIIFFT